MGSEMCIRDSIDTDWIKKMFPEKYAQKENDGILDPAAIAEAYWNMHCQPKNAWSFEIDLRPWVEHW